MSGLSEKARALADAATEGPWEAAVLGSEGYAVRPNSDLPLRQRGYVARCTYRHFEEEKADAAFIAEARTLVPALCDENDALRTQLEIERERSTHDFEEAHAAQAARIRELEAALVHYETYKVGCPCGARPEHYDTHPHVMGCPVGIAMGNTVATNYERAVADADE